MVPERILKRSENALAELTTPHLSAMISATSDIALVLDKTGVVRDLSVSVTDIPGEVCDGWLGKPFAETVTVESVEKVQRLLEVHDGDGAVITHAHVNHPCNNGSDLPVRYSSAPLNDQWIIALGRNLSPLAEAQRRLLAAQHQADTEYRELKKAEGRFREFYYLNNEPSLFIGPDDRINSANKNALDRFSSIPRLLGRRAADLVKPGEREELVAAIEDVRKSRVAQTVTLSVGRLVIAPVRYEAGSLLLRLTDEPVALAAPKDRLAHVMEAMPDGFVVTDPHFSILSANTAFANMTEAGDALAISGTSLDRWLGRPGVDLSVIRNALADTGALRAFATVVKGDLGHIQDVEVSATKVRDSQGEYIGLSVRQASPAEPLATTRSAQELTDLVGRVPIKEIVRETTDTIERMCIEAALDISGDNRASAAELLGLSRQSLYVKMRRFGIVDADGDNDSANHH
ncbi:MAG: transcriptional regulator PpsR [Pseudomonadota bacterium]